MTKSVGWPATTTIRMRTINARARTMGNIKFLSIDELIEEPGKLPTRVPKQEQRAHKNNAEDRVEEMPRIFNEGVECDDIDDDRAEQKKADIAQTGHQHDQAANKLEHFHTLDVARGDESGHKMSGRCAVGQLRKRHEVKQYRNARRKETESQQGAGNGRKIFFHKQRV